MFLARKISRAKWEPTHGVAEGEIPADAVTADLRTSQNTISTWSCGSGEEHEVFDAALALAAGYERLDKIDVVWLSDKDLQDDGLSLRPTPGRTPVKELVDRHVDIHRLDLDRLGRLARRVMTAIETGRVLRLTRKRVRDLLAQAVKEGRVRLNDLKQRLQEEVAAALDQRPG